MSEWVTVKGKIIKSQGNFVQVENVRRERTWLNVNMFRDKQDLVEHNVLKNFEIDITYQPEILD